MLNKSAFRIAIVGMLLMVLVGSAMSLACSKKSASPGDITITSSVDSGHTHDVTVSGADIDNPPAADKTVNSTYSGGHRHTITLTPQDYESIKDGGEVTVTSSSNAGHTHTFVIKK